MGIVTFLCDCCERTITDFRSCEFTLEVAGIGSFTLCRGCRGTVFEKLRPVHLLHQPDRLYDPPVDGPPDDVTVWEEEDPDLWNPEEWFWEPLPIYLKELVKEKEDELSCLKDVQLTKSSSNSKSLPTGTRTHKMKTRSMSLLPHAALD